MVEPDSLVLEQLRAIRGDIGRLVSEMQTMRVEMTAMRQHMAGMMTIQDTITSTLPQSKPALIGSRNVSNSRM